MRLLKFCLALLTFFTLQVFSQDKSYQLFGIDSTKTQQQKLSEELKFKNFFQYDSKKRMSIDDLSSLKLYGKAINDSVILMRHYYLDFNENYKDSTEDFKKSFGLLMEYAKNDHNKYDLGEFGRYLGISRKILAIILAILSVAK
jgi:hypothetical protein